MSSSCPSGHDSGEEVEAEAELLGLDVLLGLEVLLGLDVLLGLEMLAEVVLGESPFEDVDKQAGSLA